MPKARPACKSSQGSGEFGNSHWTLETDAVLCTEQDFEDMWRCAPPPEPNPMNPATNLRRRQGTWGAKYVFSSQKPAFLGLLAEAPELVQRCVAYASEKAGEADFMYTGAHCNWYPDGTAGLGMHQDEVSAGDARELPIFSFTFLSGGPKEGREFVISRTKARTPVDIVARPRLPHGSVLSMGGRFQKELWHGVPPTTAKAFSAQRRVNITVRPWAGAAEVKGANFCFGAPFKLSKIVHSRHTERRLSPRERSQKKRVRHRVEHCASQKTRFLLDDRHVVARDLQHSLFLGCGHFPNVLRVWRRAPEHENVRKRGAKVPREHCQRKLRVLRVVHWYLRARMPGIKGGSYTSTAPVRFFCNACFLADSHTAENGVSVCNFSQYRYETVIKTQNTGTESTSKSIRNRKSAYWLTIKNISNADSAYFSHSPEGGRSREFLFLFCRTRSTPSIGVECM